jgi:galactofuranose transport system permease protein
VSTPTPVTTRVLPAGRGAALRALAPLLWPTLSLALLLAVNLVTARSFFALEYRDGQLYGSLIDVLNRGAPVMILAQGMTLVIATGGLDLSIGAIMALAGATAACLIARPEDSPLYGLNVQHSLPLILALALGVALVCGLWNGLLIAYLRLQPIVATLILMVAGRGAAQLLTNGQIPTFEYPAFEFLGTGSFLGLPFPVTLAVGTLLLVLLLIRGTALGLFIEAVGSNPVTARLAGVNAAGVKLACYMLVGLLSGLAGLIATADIKAADVNNIGMYTELDAILAVALGGTSLYGGRFSLVGSLLGALVIQLLTTTILANNVPPDVTKVVKAAVVVAICLLQSPKFRSVILRRAGRAA